MKCIVVPVQFTSRSTNAARYAADLAVKLGADLRLLYVSSPPATRPLTPPVMEEILNSGLECLKSLEGVLRDHTKGKLRIHSDHQTGKKEECIRALCNTANPFLVVTDGPADFRIPCPVLSVPENAVFKSLKSVVVACDRNDILSGMGDHLAFLEELHYCFGCQFELVHVIKEGENSLSRVILEYNKWKTRPVYFSPKLNFLHKDEPREGISEYLRGHHADWLMVLPKTHSWIEFHKSQAKNISAASTIPVLNIYE